MIIVIYDCDHGYNHNYDQNYSCNYTTVIRSYRNDDCAISYHNIIPCYIVLNHPILFDFTPYCIVLRCMALYHVTLCYYVFCYIIPYYIVSYDDYSVILYSYILFCINSIFFYMSLSIPLLFYIILHYSISMLFYIILYNIDVRSYDTM